MGHRQLIRRSAIQSISKLNYDQDRHCVDRNFRWGRPEDKTIFTNSYLDITKEGRSPTRTTELFLGIISMSFTRLFVTDKTPFSWSKYFTTAITKLHSICVSQYKQIYLISHYKYVDVLIVISVIDTFLVLFDM